MAFDLPTSLSLARADDEFTGRMLATDDGMLLDMLAAVARRDYDDRRGQAEGVDEAKAAGRFDGRADHRKRNEGIAPCSGPARPGSGRRMPSGAAARRWRG